MVRGISLAFKGGNHMNQLQKERIAELRSNGAGYGKIADVLGMSVNTVKSYCRRNNLVGHQAESVPVTINQTYCKQCGAELIQPSGKKQLKFCSDVCRTKWWNSHPEKVNKKAVYSFTCAFCNVSFTAYGNSKRKYCSHGCYLKDRFKVGDQA